MPLFPLSCLSFAYQITNAQLEGAQELRKNMMGLPPQTPPPRPPQHISSSGMKSGLSGPTLLLTSCDRTPVWGHVAGGQRKGKPAGVCPHLRSPEFPRLERKAPPTAASVGPASLSALMPTSGFGVALRPGGGVGGTPEENDEDSPLCFSPPPPRPLLRQSPQSRSRHSVQDWSLHSVW